MGITGYDVSILPGLIFLGIIPILFLINFLFNIFVLWLMLRFDKTKIKTSEILLPIFIHTILVGIAEIILIFVSYFSYLIVNNFVLSTFLYGIFSFVLIFLSIKIFIPMFIKLDKKKVDKYAIIMGIVTNPGVIVIIIIFLLKLF
jgi:hypothetical protein